MNDLQADYLVIGSGIAGLWFSYRCAGHGSVLVITKKEDTESNTNYAQGGIAAAVDDDDDARLHYEDTLRAGAGIARPEAVKLVTESGPALVRELFDLGVPFTTYTDAAGRRRFDLGQEGGHRRRRIVHARDFTGIEIERGLLKTVRSRSSVRVLEEHLVLDLALDGSGRCCGVHVLDTETGRVRSVAARVCLLATGGIGQAYRYTTNPRIATGDGIAMAYRAGARIADMEFIQFHPTSLHGHRLDDRAFLISEAVRGEGAVLRTKDGHAFMPEYHPDAELAPRDVVARAIATEMKRHGDEYVLLDATHLDPVRLRERFPNISETCLELGIDITRRPIPVVPAAHYVCGGVATSIWAETSVPGLFAAGECACSGLHGANRLASNSLLEALVFADRAALRARAIPAGLKTCMPAQPPSLTRSSAADDDSAAGILVRLQTLMWNNAGIVRSDAGLARAKSELSELAEMAKPLAGKASVNCLELRNLLHVSRLIVECALRRPESRGLHYNEDHPETDDHLSQDTTLTRADVEPAA